MGFMENIFGTIKKERTETCEYCGEKIEKRGKFFTGEIDWYAPSREGCDGSEWRHSPKRR